jgi:hypothetical protein
MGLTMSIGGGGSSTSASVGMYTQCPTISSRSIGGGLSQAAHSHGSGGEGSPEDPIGSAGFVYSASRVGGGALGYYAYANSGTAAAEELLRKGSCTFPVEPSHMQLSWYVTAFIYDYVALIVL